MNFVHLLRRRPFFLCPSSPLIADRRPRLPSVRGLEITRERIRIFAEAYNGLGDIEIKDKYDDEGQALGTLVEIKLPLLYNEHLESDHS